MIKTDKNLRDSYKTYANVSDNPVDIRDYLLLVGNYNKFLIDNVLDGYEVVLPMKVGIISIIGAVPKITFDDDGNPNLPVNWPATWQLWKKKPESKEQKKKIYHTNDHTDGVRYKYFWSKKKMFVVNKNLYSLRLTRENKRAVPMMVAQGKEYFVKN